MNTRNPKWHLGLSIAMIACACLLLLLTALHGGAGGLTDYAIGAGLLAVGLWNVWANLRNRGMPDPAPEDSGGDISDAG